MASPIQMQESNIAYLRRELARAQAQREGNVRELDRLLAEGRPPGAVTHQTTRLANTEKLIENLELSLREATERARLLGTESSDAALHPPSTHEPSDKEELKTPTPNAVDGANGQADADRILSLHREHGPKLGRA